MSIIIKKINNDNIITMSVLEEEVNRIWTEYIELFDDEESLEYFRSIANLNTEKLHTLWEDEMIAFINETHPLYKVEFHTDDGLRQRIIQRWSMYNSNYTLFIIDNTVYLYGVSVDGRAHSSIEGLGAEVSYVDLTN